MKKTFSELRFIKAPLMRWIAFFIGCVVLVVAVLAWMSSAMVDGIIERVQVAQVEKMDSVCAGIDLHLTDTLKDRKSVV